MLKYRMICMMFVIVGCTTSYLQAQEKGLPEYQIKKIRKPLVIDGKMDERVWEKAGWTNDFVDITGDKKKHPGFRTRCKMLWDKDHLYIAVEMEEPHLWATMTKHDDIIYRDNDFEVFIDPGADQTNYFEIEVNALNTAMELFMNKSYKNGGTYDMNWNAEGMKTAVGLHGTLNNQSDTDTSWVLEMMIPFKALQKEDRIYRPQKGRSWRINFSRVEWNMEMRDGKYQDRKNEQGKNVPEDNWVWSPIGVINMHIPEKWGSIIFK